MNYFAYIVKTFFKIFIHWSFKHVRYKYRWQWSQHVFLYGKPAWYGRQRKKGPYKGTLYNENKVDIICNSAETLMLQSWLYDNEKIFYNYIKNVINMI